MERGDIDSGMPDRLLFTWDALAGVPDEHVLRYKVFLRVKQWDRACSCWEFFPLMLRWITQIAWDTSMKLDVVTFNPEPFADALKNRFDRHSVPINHVYAMEPDELAMKMPYMLDVRKVFFGNPEHVFKYGSRGEQVPRGGSGWNPWT